MTRTEEIAANLAQLRAHIPDHVTLICVTKGHPLADVEILQSLGEKNFGENRTSELVAKASELSATWHFQGQIQSNKLKDIARYADVVHSLDDISHVRRLDSMLTRSIDAFIQVSLDGAQHRAGVQPQDLSGIATEIMESTHLNLVGLMAVAPLNEESDAAFARLATIHSDFSRDFPMATSLSAGMSGDYLSAISHGATHIRIGSQILGSRTQTR